MQTNSAATFTLASVLDAAGLGGTEPIRTASALLAALARQPGADDPDHAAAHNRLAADTVRWLGPDKARAMLADAPPEAAMMTLARLVAYGVPAAEILDYLPTRTERAA